jgi:Holliday junction resolvasome RuvABC endonuclease subunit
MGPVTIGVDPGSWTIGIALIGADGVVQQTWAIHDREQDYMKRLRLLCAYSYQVLSAIRKQYPSERIVLVLETGIFSTKRHQATVIAKLGEVRGIICAHAWRLGMEVEMMHPSTWKTRLTESERGMAKDKAYVTYWNSKWGTECRTADEIDAGQIGRRFVLGKKVA